MAFHWAYSILCCTGDQKLYAVFLIWSNKCWADGDKNFSETTGCVPVNNRPRCSCPLLLADTLPCWPPGQESCDPDKGMLICSGFTSSTYLFCWHGPTAWKFQLPCRWMNQRVFLLRKGKGSLGLQILPDELQALCNGCHRSACVACAGSTNTVSVFPL